MIRGLYSAASALQVASEQQEVTAYNLANTSTPGYRGRGLVVESFDRVLGHATTPTGDILGAKTVQAYHDLRPGTLQQTGNRFDLALGDPDRFFVLEGPNGPLYTRNGTFYQTTEGQIVSQGGYPLVGQNGPVTLPGGTTLFNVASDGSITANGTPNGQLQIVRFANPAQLSATGPTLYTAPPEAGLETAPGRVLQGYREGSNVQPAEAMVRMIIGAGYYDAAQRALRTISDSVQMNTRPQQS